MAGEWGGGGWVVVVTPELLTQLLITGKAGSSLHLFFSGRGIGDNKEPSVMVLMSEAQVCVIQVFLVRSYEGHV